TDPSGPSGQTAPTIPKARRTAAGNPEATAGASPAGTTAPPRGYRRSAPVPARPRRNRPRPNTPSVPSTRRNTGSSIAWSPQSAAAPANCRSRPSAADSPNHDANRPSAGDANAGPGRSPNGGAGAKHAHAASDGDDGASRGA